MALVRCTCVVELRCGGEALEPRVVLLDPACGYVVHRAAADLVLLGED